VATDFDQVSNWWKEVIGDAPDSEIRTKQNGIPTLQLESSLQAGIIRLLVQPSRYEWLYFSKNLGDDILTNTADWVFPNLGTLEESLEFFQEFCKRANTVATDSIRLAFGAALIFPVTSGKIGYEKLGEFLTESVILDSENSSDFFIELIDLNSQKK
jgi:hypothetical protein